MANGIRDRVGDFWGGLSGEKKAELISGGISALGSMKSSGEDRDDQLARDAYVRQLAAFNALQQNPYSQAISLQRANTYRNFLTGRGEDTSAITPEALAAASGQWEGERRGVGGLPGVGGDQSSLSGRGSGFAPESQQKQGGGGWKKWASMAANVALPIVTGGLSVPMQAAIMGGAGALQGAAGGGGWKGALKGGALGAGSSAMGNYLRGLSGAKGAAASLGAKGGLTMASNTLTNTGGMQNAPFSGGRSPISRGLPRPGHPNLFPPDIQTPRPSSYMPSAGGVDSIASALVDAHQGNRGGKPPFTPPPDLYETLPGGPPPGASGLPFDLSQQAGIPSSSTIPNVVGGMGMGRGGLAPMHFPPPPDQSIPPYLRRDQTGAFPDYGMGLGDFAPKERSREMPQTARDATVYPSGWGQGPTRADNPATYSSAQPRGYGDTSRGLPEGMDFTPVSPPPPFDLSQVPSPPVQGLVPNIQGGSAGPPPSPPWGLTQDAGITPNRSLMGRPPVVSPHHFTPGAWTGDWQPPWQGSPQSPLPINQPARLPGRDPRYEVPQVRPFYPSGMMPQRELPIGSGFGIMGGQVGNTPDPRVPAGVTMSPIQMYLNTLSPSDKEAFLQRLAQEGGR